MAEETLMEEGLRAWSSVASAMVIVPRDVLGMGFVDHGMGRSLRIDGELFQEIPSKEFIGFFDWMRDRNGVIRGVRLWLVRALEYLHDLWRRWPCVSIDPDNDYMLVHFSAEREYDEEATILQAFGNAMLLENTSGEFALTLGLHFIPENDMRPMLASGFDGIRLDVVPE